VPSRRRVVEYLVVLVAAIVTAAVLLVADRAGQQAAQPDTPPTSSPTTGSVVTSTGTSTPTTTVEPGPTGTSVTTVPTAPSTTTTGRPTTAPPAVPPALAGRDHERLPTTRKVVALTFDAGANADGVAPILATLRREGVPATFFLTGAFAQRFAGQSASIAAAGHRLGNHSVSHPHFPSLSDQAIRTELAGAEEAIRASTGRTSRPLFRFPFGDRDQRTIRTVNDAGYVPVRWTVDSLGWKGTSGGMTADSVTARVLNALQPGEIVLMHVGSNPDDHSTLDADALPSTIARIRAAGYGFVTLDALLT